MDVAHFVYPFVDGHLNSLHLSLYTALLQHSCTSFVWMFAFVFLGIYLGVELLGHLVTLCLIICGTVRLFSKAAARLYILTSTVLRVLTSSHPCQHLLLSEFLVLPILASVLSQLACVC